MSKVDQVLTYASPTNTMVAATVLTFTTYLIWKQLTKKKYRLPPGPTPLPILGNILELGNDPFIQIHFMKMAKKYGPVFKVKVGMINTVVLNSAESIRDSLIARQNDFAGRPSFYSMNIIPDVDKSIFLGDFTPEWVVQRKIAHAAIRKFATGRHLEELLHYSMDNIADLLLKEKEPLDPKYIMSLLIYNIIAFMCFGKRYELDDPQFLKLIDVNEKATEALGNGMAPDFFPFLGPLYDLFPSKMRSLFDEFNDIVVEMINEAFDDHEKNYDPEHLSDLVYEVIHHMKQEDSMNLDRAYMTNILSDMFFAGTDTSRFTLIWFIHYVAGHPQVQEKLQKEVDEVVGQNQPVCLSHRTKLPYCDAVLMEVLRLRPPAPLSVPHKTTCDTKLGEYDIPAGWQVLPNLWALHMDPDQWESPEEFRPERFLDSSGQLDIKSSYFLPFSTGRRVCVGESLAKSELHLLIAMLVQKFSFTPGPGEKLDGQMFETGLVCMPKPFKVSIEPRV